jgi:hypothetical protein
VARVAVTGSALSFEVKRRHPNGAIIKVPLGRRAVQTVTANGHQARSLTEQRFGQRWLLIVVPTGKTQVKCGLTDALPPVDDTK